MKNLNTNVKYKKINMKKLYLIIVGCLLFLTQASANNLVLGTTQYIDSYTNAGVTYKALRFTITWDNSWSITTGPANWDGVWIFVKRQNCSGTNNWNHQKLGTTTGDHIAKNGAGNVSPEVQVDPVSDGMGVFIRRYGTNVTGSVPTTTVWLKLDVSSTGTNPVSTMSSQDNFQIYGIEMVYVPQGPFFAGDGRTPNLYNFSNGTAIAPFSVTAAVQAAGAGSANNYTALASWGCPAPLPATFPLGYNGFYCMKTEATTGIFLEFLNSLTYDQQTTILQEAGASLLPNVTGSWFDAPNYQAWYTRVSTPGTFNTVPAVFSGYNPWIAEGNVIWRTMIAFLDWSALRPMTEFEFEKACRGSNTVTAGNPPTAMNVVDKEYPWGSTALYNAQFASDYNNANSGPGTNADGPAFYTGWNYTPTRVGVFAKAATNRVQAGATYYGILDMAGNVWEQCIGGSGYDYSSFTTANGDGALTPRGYANVAGWPSNGGVGSGTIIKGGWYEIGATTSRLQTSDRSMYLGYQWNGDKSDYNNSKFNGCRGVRSFQY
jgi:formylglycine-generating enzyme required for sulfatase activity